MIALQVAVVGMDGTGNCSCSGGDDGVACGGHGDDGCGWLWLVVIGCDFVCKYCGDECVTIVMMTMVIGCIDGVGCDDVHCKD